MVRHSIIRYRQMPGPRSKRTGQFGDEFEDSIPEEEALVTTRGTRAPVKRPRSLDEPLPPLPQLLGAIPPRSCVGSLPQAAWGIRRRRNLWRR